MYSMPRHPSPQFATLPAPASPDWKSVPYRDWQDHMDPQALFGLHSTLSPIVSAIVAIWGEPAVSNQEPFPTRGTQEKLE